MNIDKLTKKLNEFQEKINKYQVQLDILNGNNRSYSYFKFVMFAKMSAWGQSEMPTNYFELPHELKKQIAEIYQDWLDKKIKTLKNEREEIIKTLAKEIK